MYVALLYFVYIISLRTRISHRMSYSASRDSSRRLATG